MRLKLTFQIVLKSDYHISAGHGKGALIDSALLRDSDGVPVIRGTTLTGLLRDGLWRLLQMKPLKDKFGNMLHDEAQYCSQQAIGPDSDLCPFCRLFGTPHRPKIWHISSARLVEAQTPTSSKHQPEGQTVTRVRIDPRTRRAEPRKLFSQEEGDGRWIFQFTVTWPTDDAGNLDEAALLTAAARNVRQLGRSRRRGQGECLFTLVGVEGTDAITPKKTDTDKGGWQTALLERFAAHWINGEPSPPSKPTTMPVTITDESGHDAPVRVRLFVRTDEPLLIARRAEAGNQFESLPFITGQVLRGALAWRTAQRFDLSQREGEAYKAFLHTFLSGEVLFPPLYPAEFVTSALRPTIPPPRDLLTCKIGGLDHGLWFATEQVPEACDQCGSETLVEVKDFVTLSEYTWPRNPLYDQLKRSSEMHIRIDLEKGRVSEGDLFGYVALDAGQYFVGDLICANEAAWKRLQALAQIEPNKPIVLRLGKARHRGYGQVTAWFQVIPDASDDIWIRRPLEERVGATEHELRLTLLTDAIITDHWGRYVTGFEEEWLGGILGQEVKITKAVASIRAVDGFNAQLGLPRWRDIALSAGSTVRLQLTEAPNLDHLRQLEQQGIGLRRNEGFGRIAFNHPVYTHCQGITSDNFDLPQALYLGSIISSSDEKRFREEWLTVLDSQPWEEKAQDPKLIAVARVLHTFADVPPSDLKARLASLGELPEEAIELLGGEQEYGKRHTLKPEVDKLANHPGVKLVGQLLMELEAFDEAFWPLGIQMLADRMAAAAGKEEAK